MLSGIMKEHPQYIDMQPPEHPSNLPAGIEWNDLGDMAEIIQFRAESMGFEVRWDCFVNGKHKIINHKSVFKGKDIPGLNELRSKARESFREYALS